MTRNKRIVIPGAPHHVTQRGVRRQDVFFSKQDYVFYLWLLRLYCKRHDIYILAYCLMKNHIHLLLVPSSKVALSRAMHGMHMNFAQKVNADHKWKGHLWQERYYSSPLDESHFWAAARYIEQNPVRAGIVECASEYEWSSARLRCSGRQDRNLRLNKKWRNILAQRDNWSAFIDDAQCESLNQKLRESTQRDLPLGSKNYIAALENVYGRSLVAKKVGRPRNRTCSNFKMKK